MIAKFRNGKVIGGRLAETFTRIGLTTEITNEEATQQEFDKPKVTKPKVTKPKQTAKKGRPKLKENEKDS